METDGVLISLARKVDAPDWVRLSHLADGVPLLSTAVEQTEVATVEATLDREPGTRFIARRGSDAVGLFELRPLGGAVELKRSYILDGLMGSYGPPLLARAVEEAGRHGRVLTVESIAESNSRLYLAAGFTVNTRTRMVMSLDGYLPLMVAPPEGVTLRPVMPDDEPLFAHMAYEHYKHTFDAPMVSASPAQAQAMMRAMFHNEYALLEPSASHLALDDEGNPAGGILLANQTTDPADRLAWVLDISIAERWRGQGLGRALLHAALNAAHDLGYDRTGLLVTLSNETALALYRSVGFESYGDTMYEGWIELT